MAKVELEWLKRKQEVAADRKMLAQYVDIVGNDTETATTWVPTNDQILTLGADRKHPPEFINRYLYFLNGVPPEYHLTNPNHIQRAEFTIGIQRMFYSDWLKLIESEKATGHIQPRETVLRNRPA